MNKCDIICISTHYWNDFWFRKQHFMSRFAELGHRVLYVQPSYSMVRATDKPGIARNRFFMPLVEKISENIYLFSPPRMFPKPNTYISTVINYRWFGGLIASAAAKLGFVDPVLWIYRPEYSGTMEKIPHKRLVFDLADDLSAYNADDGRRGYIAGCIDNIAGKADLMVVTSPTLHDKYINKTKKCVLVSNGFDEKLFDGKPKPVPSDLAEVPRPVIGFVGVLFSFLDYDMIYEAATAIPEASFVFVGPVEKGGRAGVERLKTLPNAFFLGRKQKNDIPAYVSNFDVCINPFQVDDVSRAVSPLKVYEYLACGKPVVSTLMEGLSREEAGEWIRFVKKEQFTVALARALNGKAVSPIDIACVEAARGFSWTSQFNRLKGHLEDF